MKGKRKLMNGMKNVELLSIVVELSLPFHFQLLFTKVFVIYLFVP